MAASNDYSACAPLVASGPHELLAAIRDGGNLNELFQKIGAEERTSAARLLADPRAQRQARLLRNDAVVRLEAQTQKTSLTILRECGSGCTACCHAAVDVTPLEALAVAQSLVEDCDDAQLAAVLRRLAANTERVHAMTPQQRQEGRVACSMLDENGQCVVYHSRPIVCAGLFSFSREACNSALAGVGGSQSVPIDRFAKTAAMGVSAGLQRALVDAGLDGNLYDLQSATHAALETPRAFARWLGREDIFRDCVCTDAHSAPRKLTPSVRVDAPPTPPIPRPKFLRRPAGQTAAAKKRP